MRRSALLALASIFAASLAVSTTYYALQVRGGSRVYSIDEPVRKGRTLVFHRYPDGVYMSLVVSEVEGVLALQEPPHPEGLAPGQELVLGTALPGPSAAAAAEAPRALPVDEGYGYGYGGGYGYSGSYWGGGGFPPPPPPRTPPSRIGPNGFPILAPPGSPGSTPPPIGANGFPILAPQPPVPAPRRR
jgi:hypothetical protein